MLAGHVANGGPVEQRDPAVDDVVVRGDRPVVALQLGIAWLVGVRLGIDVGDEGGVVERRGP